MQRKTNFGLNVQYTVDETAWSVAVLNFIKIFILFYQNLNRSQRPTRCPQVLDCSTWSALHLCQFW